MLSTARVAGFGTRADGRTERRRNGVCLDSEKEGVEGGGGERPSSDCRVSIGRMVVVGNVVGIGSRYSNCRECEARGDQLL